MYFGNCFTGVSGCASSTPSLKLWCTKHPVSDIHKTTNFIANLIPMCGRYILVQKLELIEKRFNVTAPGGVEWKPAYNISPGKVAPVITSDNPKELQLFHFGMTPFFPITDQELLSRALR